MFKKSISYLLGIFLLCGCMASLSAADQLRPYVEKKFIQFGWDNPNAEYLDKNLETIETYLPHDGIGIDISKNVTKADGKRTSTAWLNFSKTRFQYEWYKKDIEHLKNVARRAKKLKYNFINSSASSFTGEFDIFDDSFWDSVCNNFSIIARVAKEGSCKGFRFDLEDYGNYQNWRYRAECGKSYKEAWNKARERGRQWMNAVAKEYPDVTIFCFFWLDLMMGYADGSPHLQERLQGCATGLLVAFINGIYDALPPKAKIVDGMESHGYAARNLQSYQTMRALRSVRFPKLLAPENQRKFFEQSSLSVATYMTCYTNATPSYSFRKYMKEEKMTPLEMFRRNFTYAVEHSDEYVWTWNEHRKWFPIRYKHGWQENALKNSPHVPGPYMGMALVGVEDAMRYAKDPWKYAYKLLENPAKLKNLLKNSSFEGKGGKNVLGLAPDSVVFKKLPNWETWKNKRSKAKFSLGVKEGINGSNALKISDGSGVAHQGVKINRHGAYIVRAKAKFIGKAGGSLGIQWRNDKGSWHNHAMSISAPFDKDLGNGWKQATVIVRTIPFGSHYMSAMLNSTGVKGSAVLFDDVEIFSIFDDEPKVAPHLKEALEKWKKRRAAEEAAKALKNAKKTPVAANNKVKNANFNLYGAFTDADTISGATLFKNKFSTYAANKNKKVKTRFYNAVGKNIGYSDDTAGVIMGNSGIILFTVRGIKGREKYRVAVKAKNVGNAKGGMKIYYSSKRVKGPFDYKLGMPVIPVSRKLDKGYALLEGVITVPQEAHAFTLILEAKGFKSEKDMVFFDEAEAVKLP